MESCHAIRCIRQYPLYRARAIQRVERGADSHSPLSTCLQHRADAVRWPHTKPAHEDKTISHMIDDAQGLDSHSHTAELVRALIGCDTSSHRARMQPRFREPLYRNPGRKFGYRKTSRPSPARVISQHAVVASRGGDGNDGQSVIHRSCMQGLETATRHPKRPPLQVGGSGGSPSPLMGFGKGHLRRGGYREIRWGFGKSGGVHLIRWGPPNEGGGT